MTNKGFIALLTMLLLCAWFIESNEDLNTLNIAKAEAETRYTMTDEGEADYFIELNEDSIYVYDGSRLVYREHYDTGSGLANAMLKDNE